MPHIVVSIIISVIILAGNADAACGSFFIVQWHLFCAFDRAVSKVYFSKATTFSPSFFSSSSSEKHFAASLFDHELGGLWHCGGNLSLH